MKLKSHHLFQLSVLSVIAALFLIGFVILNRTANPLSEKERHAALLKILGRQVNLTPTIAPQGNAVYKGKYYSFLYPAAATIYTPLNMQNASAAGLLEQFSFDLKDFPKAYFYSEVKEIPWSVSTISDYTGVSFRQNNPDQYSQSTITADNQDGLSFEKVSLGNSETYEKTAFFLVNGKIYSFTVQSGDVQAEKDLFNKVLLTLKFLD